MRRFLHKRLRRLEILLPKKTGGPMILLEEEVQGEPLPWYTPEGEPRKPLIICLDERDPSPELPPETAALLVQAPSFYADQNIDMGEDL